MEMHEDTASFRRRGPVWGTGDWSAVNRSLLSENGRDPCRGQSARARPVRSGRLSCPGRGFSRVSPHTALPPAGGRSAASWVACGFCGIAALCEEGASPSPARGDTRHGSLPGVSQGIPGSGTLPLRGWRGDHRDWPVSSQKRLQDGHKSFPGQQGRYSSPWPISSDGSRPRSRISD